MAARLAGMPENVTRTGDLSGRRVVDMEGVSYGRVRDVHIDHQTLDVAGITVRYGIARLHYVPRRDIARMTDESVLLSRPPIREGVDVLDIDGHKVGSVSAVNRNPETGEAESLGVAYGLFGSKTVSVASVWGVGEKVTLKMTRGEFRSRR